MFCKSLALGIAAIHFLGVITISCYTYEENGTATASGAVAQPYYTVATTSEIPFGTEIYIDGVGWCVVQDRGGYLIESGQRIDLFTGHDDSWGLQDRKVYVRYK